VLVLGLLYLTAMELQLGLTWNQTVGIYSVSTTVQIILLAIGVLSNSKFLCTRPRPPTSDLSDSWEVFPPRRHRRLDANIERPMRI
jgi:hypothetical protein